MAPKVTKMGARATDRKLTESRSKSQACFCQISVSSGESKSAQHETQNGVSEFQGSDVGEPENGSKSARAAA